MRFRASMLRQCCSMAIDRVPAFVQPRFLQFADTRFRPRRRRRALRRLVAPLICTSTFNLRCTALRAWDLTHFLRVKETLSDEVLAKMGAPPKDADIPVLENPSQLEQYDAFLFGIPTRYGTLTPPTTVMGALLSVHQVTSPHSGRPSGTAPAASGLRARTGASTLASSSPPAPPAEVRSLPPSPPCRPSPTTASSTCLLATSSLSVQTPRQQFVKIQADSDPAELANLDEVHGGSPWGAGTFAAGDGSRQPSALELTVARKQGKAFYETVARAFP